MLPSMFVSLLAAGSLLLQGTPGMAAPDVCDDCSELCRGCGVTFYSCPPCSCVDDSGNECTPDGCCTGSASIGLPGTTVVVRAGRVARLLAKGTFPFAFPADFPTTVGATLTISDTGSTATTAFALPAAQWSILGDPTAPRGFKYRALAASGAPCRVVVLKRHVVKALCKGTPVSVALPVAGALRVTLATGPAWRYCAEFGGIVVVNDGATFKAKRAAAPGACSPSGAFVEQAGEY